MRVCSALRRRSISFCNTVVLTAASPRTARLPRALFFVAVFAGRVGFVGRLVDRAADRLGVELFMEAVADLGLTILERGAALAAAALVAAALIIFLGQGLAERHDQKQKEN